MPTDDEKHKDKSHSATREPWNEPGQTSQDKSIKPPKNAVAQQKRKKDAAWERARR
ncbi:MAG: hypothetical protein ACK4UO_06755 [Pseudolabrys sp.]